MPRLRNICSRHSASKFKPHGNCENYYPECKKSGLLCVPNAAFYKGIVCPKLKPDERLKDEVCRSYIPGSKLSREDITRFCSRPPTNPEALEADFRNLTDLLDETMVSEVEKQRWRSEIVKCKNKFLRNFPEVETRRAPHPDERPPKRAKTFSGASSDSSPKTPSDTERSASYASSSAATSTRSEWSASGPKLKRSVEEFCNSHDTRRAFSNDEWQQINNAFKALSLFVHPDKHHNDSVARIEANELQKTLNACREKFLAHYKAFNRS